MSSGLPHVSPVALLSHPEIGTADEDLQLALDCAGMGIWHYDVSTGLVTADDRVQEIFGSVEATGNIAYWLEFLHPDDRERVVRHFREALAGASRYELEYRIVHPDGERWVRSKGRVLAQPAMRMFAVVEDITHRKRLEEDLRTNEEGMRLAQEAARIASWDWNVGTGAFKWHPKGTQVYGRPSDQLSNLDTILSYIDDEDKEKVREAAAPALEGKGEFQVEYRVVWPNGSIHWLAARGQPVLSEGKVARIVGVTMDVTERQQSEITLRQNEKLAAVGRLASSIAHEINNPLESVTNLLFLVRTSSNMDEVQEYAETAERELRRVSLIANQTLKFRKQATRPAAFYCHDLIGDALTAYQGRLVNRHVTVEKRKRAEQPVQCLGDEIRQVLSHLIGNAIDSMPMGGRLLVRSRKATDWKSQQPGLVLTVADTGIGMSAATQKRIFDAFYTTKGIGGTGLGLWLSAEIVARHGGVLRVRSSERENQSGTVFTLFLPMVATV